MNFFHWGGGGRGEGRMSRDATMIGAEQENFEHARHFLMFSWQMMLLASEQ